MIEDFAKCCGVAVLLFATPFAAADDYADARTRLVAAYQQQDYAAMVDAGEHALIARPAYPGALFNLALAHALNRDPRAALRYLDNLLEKGIDFGVAEMDEFAQVRELDEWADYQRRVRKLHEPFGEAVVAFSHDDPTFVPEGIAIDEHGALLLGSIRKGIVLRDGDVLSDRQGHWSVFGMRFHRDGSLWFASAAVPQMAHVGEDLGKTGLFQLDVQSGDIKRAAILEQHAPEQVLGDLVIVGDIVYATDSLTGAVYRYDIEADEFAVLTPRATFGSPQGLVLDETGAFLYVADYLGGLFRVSLADGGIEKLQVAGAVSDYGIDGLYRHGNRLIAIQNGIRPHRIVSFDLDDTGLAIRRVSVLAANLAEFDEPTLGVVDGDEFFFVANSHWNRFDRDQALPGGLSGPIVLKIDLRPE